MFRTLPILMVLWLSAAPLPAQEKPAEAADKESLRDFVRRTAGRQAYGLYFGKKKIGWLIEEGGLGKHEGKEAAVFEFEGHFRMSFFGQEMVSKFDAKQAFSLEGPGRLIHAREHSVDSEEDKLITAVQKDGQLEITTEIDDQKTVRRVPLPKESLRREQELDRWLMGKPQKGETFESYTTDFEQRDVDTKQVFTFRKQKSIRWGGVPMEVFIVEIDIQGASCVATITSNGDMLQGKFGAVLDIRAEEEAVAKRLDAGGIDMIAASAVAVDKDLEDPENVDSLTLELTGLKDHVFPQSHRQRVKSSRDGKVVLELLRDFRIEKPTPLSQEQREEALQTTPTLQSDHEKIRQLAKKIAGERRDPMEVARALKDWVQQNVRPSYMANASTALKVLQNRTGDCTEHAMLFVALARAAGIPAREVGGLVSGGRGEPFFAWHAWAEIHDGRQWVSVDPLWNQVFVDATHIKLAEDTQDWSWLNLVGRMKIKVVKVGGEE